MAEEKRRGSVALWLALVGALSATGTIALTDQQWDERRLYFWRDGDSWTRPTHCLNCGGRLARVDAASLQCGDCGALVAVAEVPGCAGSCVCPEK